MFSLLVIYLDYSTSCFLPFIKSAFNAQRAKKQNITVGVSFGACRELAFLKTKKGETAPDDACRIYFPQPNNCCFTFGRDVNINFKHAINALPESEHDGKGRISVLIWGWTDNVIEEEGSPRILGGRKGGGTLERNKAKNQRRKEKRKTWRLKKKEEAKAAKEVGKELVNEAGKESANANSETQDLIHA